VTRRGGRAQLITVSGMDGTGKSTQIEALATALRSAGQPTVVLWYRPGYSRELDALRRLVRRLLRGAPPPGHSEERDRILARPGVSRAWVLAALLDVVLQYGCKVRWWRLTGRNVVCDRYVDDALLDLELHFPTLHAGGWLLTRLTVATAAKPDVALLLTAPFAVLEQRLATKNEPFPDPPELRARRAVGYDELVRRGAHTVIDTTPISSAVTAAVLDAVGAQAAEARAL
jgi:thymidylate kinase